jgi:hypothetical protein
MLEGKALIVAVMMLTAAPIAATDEGQAFLGEITYDLGEMLDTDEEENKVNDRKLDDANIEDKDLLLTDENLEVDCLTLEQWKEQFLPEDKEVIREEKDGARNSDSKETDEKKDDSDEKENDLDKKDWVDKDTVTKDDCLSAEEWALKFESDRKEPCFTLEDLEKKMRNGKENWNNDGESDWDEEWFEELKILAELCQEGDEEACEELLVIREELAEDREEEERDEENDGARSGDNDSEDEEEASDDDEVTIIYDDEADDRDEEEWEEIRAVIQELAVACEDGNEEACVELREMITEIMSDRKEDWNKDWHKDGERDWNKDSCLTMEEWKKIFNGGKDRKGGHDRDDDRKERVPHRDAFVREMLEELEYACEEEGNEEACAELEEMIAEFEEREGDCDKERDDDESDEEDNHEDEDDESDEDDEWDENDEDESDDEDESNEE